MKPASSESRNATSAATSRACQPAYRDRRRDIAAIRSADRGTETIRTTRLDRDAPSMDHECPRSRRQPADDRDAHRRASGSADVGSAPGPPTAPGRCHRSERHDETARCASAPREGSRDAVGDPRRHPAVAVDPAPGRGHEENASAGRELARPVPDEVPEAVGDERPPIRPAPGVGARGRRRRCRRRRGECRASVLLSPLGHPMSSTPQWRKTTTVSTSSAPGARLASLRAVLRGREPGLRVGRGPRRDRWSSSTCVAPITAMRCP